MLLLRIIELFMIAGVNQIVFDFDILDWTLNPEWQALLRHLAGPGGKDVLTKLLNSLHRARNLMFREGLSPYSTLSRNSTSSVPIFVKGRNVTTPVGISSSSSSAEMKLISAFRRLTSPGCKVIYY